MTTIAQQLRELHDLDPGDLAERYEALFAKPPRIRNKAWLRRQVAWKLQEREFGGLSPRAKARLDELIARAPVRQVRAAVYTRESVTEGLEQEVNSLDAQRGACEAYIQSQEHEGWVALDRRYDDGGFSGANLDRPAFQLLLQDIEHGLIDAVVVYRMDRLSRRLLDIARLIELFEQHGVAMVSVTERIDTATILGRLNLNMLMSFAEYERELIGERIRDKKRATAQRGHWCGGRPILGYDVVDKRLVVNPDEAQQVRETFRIYLDQGSLSRTVAELKRRGWTNKIHVTRYGKTIGGKPFTRTTLSALLSNPLLRGLLRCGDDLVGGVHEPIAPRPAAPRSPRASGAPARSRGCGPWNRYLWAGFSAVTYQCGERPIRAGAVKPYPC